MAYQPQYYNGGGYYPQNQYGAVPDMLNQYKGQYQQGMPQMQQMQQPMIPMNAQQQIMNANATGDMIWVLSCVEAQSYPVAQNNSVILWDKNEPVIYIKSANAQGVPSMRILDYVERTADSGAISAHKGDCKCGDKFITKDELNAMEEKIEGLRDEISELKAKAKAKTAKKTVEVTEDGE